MSLARRRCEMAIDGGLRDKLAPGTRLVARYKGADYEVEVVAGEEGKTRYRFADGQEFKSPSAAGSAVMGGVACNGWRFWSLEGELAGGEPKAERKREGAPPRQPAARGGGSKARGPLFPAGKAKGGAKGKASKNGTGKVACGEC